VKSPLRENRSAGSVRGMVLLTCINFKFKGELYVYSTI
jgi:hypothetical protein